MLAGQAQKEFFVNRSLSLIDALLQNSVVSSLSVPPADPSDGEVFRVVSPASNEWDGHGDEIAIRLAGAWHFLKPQPGMSLFDRDAGVSLYYDTAWERPIEPTAPIGGTIVDAEARQMLSEVIEVLRKARIFAPTS